MKSPVYLNLSSWSRLLHALARPRGRRLLFAAALILALPAALAGSSLGDIEPPPPPPIAEAPAEIGTPAPVPATSGPVIESFAKALEIGSAQGFTVNTQDRETVRAFYTAVFQAPEGVPSGWTGSTSGHVPGILNAEYLEAIRQRVNWYRAMAGAPANITFLSSYNTDAQQAALMMARANQLSHFPPSSWPYWTQAGYDAAAKSNLALGSNGYEAVELYMQDGGVGNHETGHRRWILHPSVKEMGAGSVDAQGTTYKSAQALWVNDGRIGQTWTGVRDSDAVNGIPFVAWPPPGYVPHQQVFPRWSFSVERINGNTSSYMDSQSGVTMTKNGQALSVGSLTLPPNMGRLVTIVFTPAGYGTDADVAYAKPSQDDVYVVNVTNVMVNGTRRNFSYTVRVFDPAVPTPSAPPPAINGPAAPYIGLANAYSHTLNSFGEGYQLLSGRQVAFSAVEGAENGLADLTPWTAGNYAQVQNSTKDTGNNAFRLAHPTAATEAIVWNKVFVPGSGAVLSIRSRLRYVTTAERAHVQISTNGGLGWVDLVDSGNLFPRTGVTNGEVQGSFSTHTFPLNAYAGRPVMFRFAYDVIGFGAHYLASEDDRVGWFIDNISLTNTQELTERATIPITQAAGSLEYIPADATPRSLAVQPVGWVDYGADFGALLNIAPIAAPVLIPEVWITGTSVSGNTLNITFEARNLPLIPAWQLLSNSGPGDNYVVQGGATFHTVDAGAGKYRYSLPLPTDPTRFFRVEVN